MGRKTREKTILILLGLLAGLALFDVFTAWELMTVPAVAACLAAAAAAVFLGTRLLHRFLLGLVLVAFALHLGFNLVADYEGGRWDRLKIDKAEQALAGALQDLETMAADTQDRAASISGDPALTKSLRSRSRRETFSALERMAASGLIGPGESGVMVVSNAGERIAWIGRLPNSADTGPVAGPFEGVGIVQSTTYHWIEVVVAVQEVGIPRGWVKLYRRLDSIYPGILEKSPGATLSERLTRELGHEIRVVLGGRLERAGLDPGIDETVADIHLPDGGVGGRIAVRYRALEDERRLLMGRGLFFASAVILALLAVGAFWLVSHLVGPRFERASPVSLVAALGVMAGSRLGLSLLRDSLNLGALESFTSYYYATQLPVGILRSPADLAITSLFVGLGVAMVVLTGIRRKPVPARPGPVSGYERLPYVAGAVILGVAASGLVALVDRILTRVFADSAAVIFTLSPFDLTPSHILMRIGLLILTVTIILMVGALVAFEVGLLRRYGPGFSGRKMPLIAAGAMLYALVAVFVVVGVGRQILMTASLCLGCALVIDLVRSKALAVGLITLGLGFSLAASLVEFPYALGDHNAKRMESIQAASEELVARTDAWKISVLEEALAKIALNSAVRDALVSEKRDLDDLALELWATSILSESNLTSGVYLLDGGHQEIGRFSLQDVGQTAQIDAALRESRYLGRPLTLITRGTSGGREVELYVGLAPFFYGGEYIGSAVVSIPLAYTDMESMAGLRPSFFEALGAAGVEPDRPMGGYSASLVSGGKIIGTTAVDIDVGKRIAELDGEAFDHPAWLEHDIAGVSRASYFLPAGEGGDGWLLSYSLPTLSEKAIRFMGLMAANIIMGFLVILAGIVVRSARHVVKRLRGLTEKRMRWSFASKLALAFVLIAIVPTLILGTASRRFLAARSKEIMESKAEEGLNLSRLALDRLIFAEALRLARNPILMDALSSEPSLLGQMVTHDPSALGYDVSSAVIDSTGKELATFGRPAIPKAVLEGVLEEGRSYNFFAVEGGLTAKSAVPVRDEIYPDIVVGCAFVSRRVDDGLARRIASELGRDLSFYGSGTVAASSKRELFASELMSSTISPDAYVACFINGRELHFSWERIGGIDVVLGYRPLRGPDGNAVGAISVPVVFREGEAGGGMEWTSAAISYLIVIVICAIFIFGLLLARSISKPIHQLIQGTLRIGSGDLSFTIPKPSDDEIGDLVTSFNRMTAALAKSRKALSERKRYIETIIGNVGAGIISTDRGGRIDTFNTAAAGILGIKPRNARGRDARMVLRRAGASGLAEVLDEVGGHREVAGKEVSFTAKDGRSATLRAVATVVGELRRRVMGKVIVFEDVTELIRSKKLVAWSEMARQVAHEIKNPLTPMKLSAQHLLQARKDRVSDFDQVLEESVGTIVEQIESLRRIAVEFSQFSRMPERKPEWLDAGNIVEESLGQYERAVGTSVDITKNLDPGVPKIRVDRDEAKRVFVNIIENAIQAMPEGGTLEIGCRRIRPRRVGDRGPGSRRPGAGYEIRVSSSETGLGSRNSVEVAFSDTGTGISGANAGKLFEPNFSTKSHGTGLGLAICKGIMDAYGGEILIESKQGLGTRVSVRFPIPRGRSTSTPRPPRRPGSRGSGRRHRPPRV